MAILGYVLGNLLLLLLVFAFVVAACSSTVALGLRFACSLTRFAQPSSKEAFKIGAVVTFVLSVAWGILGNASAPDVVYLSILPLMGFVYSVSLSVTFQRGLLLAVIQVALFTAGVALAGGLYYAFGLYGAGF